MASNPSPQRDTGQPGVYQIRLKGHLSPQWTDWFEGLTITLEETGDTLLTGVVIDQPALHGFLKKVRDLGLPLISINRVNPKGDDVSLERRRDLLSKSRRRAA